MLGLAPPPAGVGSSPATPTERESHIGSLFFAGIVVFLSGLAPPPIAGQAAAGGSRFGSDPVKK